jgi:hypothetical protein
MYADCVYDISTYQELECKDEKDAINKLINCRNDAEILATYTTIENNSRTISLHCKPTEFTDIGGNNGNQVATTSNYVVFPVRLSMDVVKNFKLTGDHSNVTEVLVTVGNTVIFRHEASRAHSASNTGAPVPSSYIKEFDGFFTAWFPVVMSPFSPMKVYCKIKEVKRDQYITLSYTSGMMPVQTRRDNMPGNGVGLWIKPYNCIIRDGRNITDSAATRDGYRMSHYYTDKYTCIGTVTAHNNISNSNSIMNANNILNAAEVDLTQFGTAHRNIRVTSRVPCTVSLKLNGDEYYQKTLPDGGEDVLIHNVPIIHSPYTQCTLDVSCSPEQSCIPERFTVKWDAMVLHENPEKFKGRIVIPEFDLVISGGSTGIKSMGIWGTSIGGKNARM